MNSARGAKTFWGKLSSLVRVEFPPMHRLQVSRNLRDSPGFSSFVPGPGRPFNLSRILEKLLLSMHIMASTIISLVAKCVIL